MSRILFLGLALLLTLSACKSSELNDGPMTRPTLTLNADGLDASATIVANAASQPELSSLVAAVQRAGLVDALNGAGPFTVFAPINAAFDDVDAAEMDLTELQNVLQYHVVSGRYTSGELPEGTRLTTLQGRQISVGSEINDRTQLTVDDADIIYADIPASNGVIHLINLVLTPEPGGQGR